MTMPSEESGLCARGVSFAYRSTEVLKSVTLDLPSAGMLALIGPNGSGKSTLLKLLSGARAPAAGEVRIDGASLTDLSPRERARRIAVVAQHVNPSLTFRVDSLVAMGRTPHLGFLGAVTAGDRKAVHDALRMTDSAELGGRRFSELSGGEQQRVVLAVALAQDARYLLLDEPTVHLDLYHQHQLLELLRSLHAVRGLGILAVMHDLNIASLYFDRLAVLDRGRLVAQGPTHEVLSMPEVLNVFRAPLALVTHPQTGDPQVLLRRGP